MKKQETDTRESGLKLNLTRVIAAAAVIDALKTLEDLAVAKQLLLQEKD